VLLVICTKAAIVRAAVMHIGIKTQRGFRRFIIIADVLIVFNICGNDYFMKPMLGAGLQHIHLAILKYYFSIYALKAYRAKAEGKVVIGIFSNGHIFVLR
jgi:hypothetical protein